MAQEPNPSRPKRRLRKNVLGVRVDDRLKVEIEEAALAEDLSVSRWIADTLRAALSRHAPQKKASRK